MKRKKISSLLGVCPGEGTISFVQNSDDSGIVAITVPIKSDFCKSSADELATELRDIIVRNDIRIKKATFCLPANWLLTIPVDVPQLSQEELDNFLTLQIERQLCVNENDFVFSLSRTNSGRASLILLKRTILEKIIETFAMLKIEFVDIVPSVSTLQYNNESLLFFGERGVELLATDNESVNISSVSVKGGNIQDNLEAFTREVKIKFNKIFQSKTRKINVFTLAQNCELVRTKLKREFSGFNFEMAKVPENLTITKTNQISMWPALKSTENFLSEGLSEISFKPTQAVRKNHLKIMAKCKRTRLIAAVVSLIVVIGIYMFGSQMLELNGLRNQFARLEPEVVKVRIMKQKLTSLEKWFSTDAESLELLKLITTAFPETGTVWLTSVSFSGNGKIFLAGKATTKAAWLTMQNALRVKSGVKDLMVQQTRSQGNGKGEMTFSLNFTYKRG